MPRAYRLSTSDQPTAGSIVGDELVEDIGFFPFSLLVGAMAMVGAELKSNWKAEAEIRGRRGNRKHAASKGEITV